MTRRAALSDAALWLCVACAAVLALMVEWMAAKVVAGSGGQGDWLALSLFILPLLISFAAVTMILSRRPARMRWAAAVTILVLPPLLLGAFHG